MTRLWYSLALLLIFPLVASAQSVDPDTARAIELLQAGDTAQALPLLEARAQAEPGSQASRILGVVLFGNGRPAAAYPHLRAWIEKHPDDQNIRLTTAAAAVQLGHLSDAEGFLEGVPIDDPPMRLLWAEIHYARQDGAAVIEVLAPLAGRALTLPEAVDIQRRRLTARAQLLQNDVAGARATLEGHTSGRPLLATILAEAHYRAGDLVDAAATLEPHVGSAEVVPAVVQDLGAYLVELGRFQAALPHLERAVELSPEHAASWQNLSRARAGLGREDEAEAAAARASELAATAKPRPAARTGRQTGTEDPIDDALREAARMAAADDVDGALARVNKEIALVPDEPRLHAAASRLLLQLERIDQALEAAGQALRLAPKQGDNWVHRGNVQLEKGDFAAAEADFRKAIEVAPGHLAARNQLAVALIAQGETAQGRSVLEAILAEHPDNGVARANLERLDNP